MKQRLWQKNIPKIKVKQIENNGKSYPYLYPIGDLIQGNFHTSFHVCTNQKSLFKNFVSNSELKINDGPSDDACNYVGANDNVSDGWWWCLWHIEVKKWRSWNWMKIIRKRDGSEKE